MSYTSMRKRAVSPMVATMLMIFFAIALGTVIMTWGSSYAAQQGDYQHRQEEAVIKCERFIELKASEQPMDICVSPLKKRLRYTIVNSGEIPVDGLRVIMIGQKNFETTFFDVDMAPLAVDETRTFNQDFDYSRLGHIGQLEIYPKILLRDSTTEFYRCPEKILIDNIQEC